MPARPCSFHIEMDVTTAVLTPRVVGHSPWWTQASGNWDFSDPNRVAAEMFFEWNDCEIVGVGIGTCNRTIKATFSTDGTELLWNESIRALRTHVPWYRCELVPEKCVGTVRYPGLPSVGTITIMRRLMFGRLHSHVILAVNRTYEFDHLYLTYMTGYRFGIGELREGEWISFRSGQWGAINNPNDEFSVPVSQTVSIDGASYSTSRMPRREPAPGEQPGVLSTSPRPAAEWAKAASPPEGYTFDPVTQTSTWTIVGPPACASSVNQPCIHKAGSYFASSEHPSPPPSPPVPPVYPPGFFTPSPAPPYPAAPPDGLRLWSQASTWGGRVPRRGDTVEIPRGITIVMDVSPPFLWRLNVKGTLMVLNRPTTDITLHLVFLHIAEDGTMLAGSPGSPFRGKLEIQLAGDEFSEPRNFCQSGYKTICVEGRLFLHGRLPNRAWTRLNSTAGPGGDALILQEQVDWAADDEVIIAATGYDQAEAERTTVGEALYRLGEGLGSPTVLRQLSPSLNHRHYAAIEKHGAFDVDLRAEVALVSRNIVIRAVDMFDADYFFKPQAVERGAKLRVEAGGEAYLVAVRVVRGGFWKNPKEYAPTIKLAAYGSVIRSCVFDQMFAQPIRTLARGVVIDRNLIINSVMSGIQIANPGAIVTDNLVLGAHCFDFCAGCCGKWNVIAGAYEILAGASVDTIFTGNVAAGGPIGIKIDTAPPEVFRDNVVHSAQFGIAVNGFCDNRPVRVADTLIYRAWDFALWGHTVDADVFEFDRLQLVDSKVAMTWGAVGPDSAQHIIGDQRIVLRNSLILGQSYGNSGQCDSVGSTGMAFSWIADKPQTGIMMPIFVTQYPGWPGACSPPQEWAASVLLLPMLRASP